MKRKIVIQMSKLVAVLVVLHFVSRGFVAAEDAIFGEVAEAAIAAESYLAYSRGYEKPVVMEHHTAQMLADKEALIAGINPSLVRAMMHVESSGNEFAESHVGAISYMQIMPFNAKRCGLKHYSQLWQPENNIRCGVQIIGEELKATGGNLRRALERYNGGGACDGKDKLSPCAESRNYVVKVLTKMARDIR